MALKNEIFFSGQCNKAGQTINTINHISFVLDKHTNIKELLNLQ
jgi:hypothetical protein